MATWIWTQPELPRWLEVVVGEGLQLPRSHEEGEPQEPDISRRAHAKAGIVSTMMLSKDLFCAPWVWLRAISFLRAPNTTHEYQHMIANPCSEIVIQVQERGQLRLLYGASKRVKHPQTLTEVLKIFLHSWCVRHLRPKEILGIW